MKNPWPLLLPGLILYAVFTILPILLTAIGSVVDMGTYGDGWIGLSAWKEVLSGARFWMAMRNTIRFTAVLVPSTLILALVVAVVLSWTKFRGFGRMAFYVPGITSAVMISQIWKWLLLGPLHHLTGITWLGANPWAFWSVCIMTLSVTLGAPVIYLMAGFATVDPSLYEAARLDGCNRVQEAWHITIPAIAPILLFLYVERIAGVIQLWQFPYAVTGGGPNYGTTTLMLEAYQQAFLNGNLAQGSVISLILMCMVGVFVYMTRVVTKQEVID